MLEKLKAIAQDWKKFANGIYLSLMMEKDDTNFDKFSSSKKISDAVNEALGSFSWDSKVEELEQDLAKWEKETKKEVFRQRNPNIKDCFGEMPDSNHAVLYAPVEVKSLVRELNSYTKYSAFLKVLDRVLSNGEKYIAYMERMAECAECPLFDRCHKISALRQNSELTEYLIVNLPQS